MQVINGLAGLQELVGQHVGYSDWLEIDQARIDEFAHATGDLQWIHVDVERAKAESPYGSTIAHGFLTVALIAGLQDQIYTVEGVTMGVNYGSNKVRFPAAVPVGSKVRLGAALQSVEPLPNDWAQVTWAFTIEIADSAKPACVAECVFRFAF
jgi:acyl dehydratase